VARSLRTIPGLALLALGVAISAVAAERNAPTPASSDGAFALHVRKARSLLRSGLIRQALTEAELAESSAPGRAETTALLGDIAFRRANFEAAERHFNAAVAIDPGCVQAHLGLGRLDLLHFRRRAALQRIVTAYALNPNDAETVLAYATVASDPQQEMILLERFLALGADMPREQLESALGRLQFRRRLGSRKVALLDGPYQAYRLPLTAWYPRAQASNGLLLAVSINGSKPLRLVLDTGAEGIVISGRVAKKLGLEYLADAGLRGVGRSGVETRKTLADSVRIGDLRLRNCVVDVADGTIAEQIDGAIGSDLFAQFIVRLDARGKMLELLPYPGEAPQDQSLDRLWAGHDRTVPPGMENLTPVCQAGHLLLVNATLPAAVSGYLILDTGAAVSSLSRQMAVPSREPPQFDLAGPGGGVVGGFRLGAVQLHIAGRDLTDPNVVTLDFARLSNIHGLEISGLIGYPMLSHCALTLNYRDGLIGLDRGR
jgi:tetratricopeptide (TPR) repeat protein